MEWPGKLKSTLCKNTDKCRYPETTQFLKQRKNKPDFKQTHKHCNADKQFYKILLAEECWAKGHLLEPNFNHRKMWRNNNGKPLYKHKPMLSNVVRRP